MNMMKILFSTKQQPIIYVDNVDNLYSIFYNIIFIEINKYNKNKKNNFVVSYV